MQGVASKNAPHISVVIPHYAFAGLAFFAITVLLCLHPDSLTQHHFNPKLLSITHIAVLGWISMVIFGALYQIIPVILEVKLYSEFLAKLNFALLIAGTATLSYGFWTQQHSTWLLTGGIILLPAVLIFAFNVWMSGHQSSKASIEKLFILTSVVWLLITASVGLALVINLFLPWLPVSHLELLKLHAHAGAIGWFLLLIIGVASRLLPMFLVAHNLNKTKLTVTYGLVNAGLILLLIGFYFESGLLVKLSGGIIFSGVLVFLWFIIVAFRKRLKQSLDIGMQQTALSFLILIVPALLFFIFSFKGEKSGSLIMSFPLAYGSSIFLGFISSLILGQTFKTLPFIVWLDKYRGKVGKMKVPMPKDLYSHKVAVAQLWLYTIGFILMMGGILLAHETVIRVAACFLLITAALYNFNVLKIIFHKPDYHVE